MLLLLLLGRLSSLYHYPGRLLYTYGVICCTMLCFPSGYAFLGFLFAALRFSDPCLHSSNAQVQLDVQKRAKKKLQKKNWPQ